MPGLKAMIPLDGSHLSESALSVLPFLKTLGFDALRLWWHDGIVLCRTSRRKT